jgi:cob(I)alamin adenosyltransferase
MTQRSMKIYTRRGDDGSTGLVDNTRISKDSDRMEAIGALDELNASVGFLYAGVMERKLGDLHVTLEDGSVHSLNSMLHTIQRLLLQAGHVLSMPANTAPDQMPVFEETACRTLEKWMDAMQKELEPLRAFILPGSGELNARTHLARTICRRAERNLCRFAQDASVSSSLSAWLNRLSDWLFVTARWIGHHQGEQELLWHD